MSDDRFSFSSGAMSSGAKPRYDLIPLWALERIAVRFGEGAAKYGDNNWMRGLRDRDYIIDRINHLIEHAYRLKERVAAEQPPYVDDDAAAIILNAIFIMGWERANVNPVNVAGPTVTMPCRTDYELPDPDQGHGAGDGFGGQDF